MSHSNWPSKLFVGSTLTIEIRLTVSHYRLSQHKHMPKTTWMSIHYTDKLTEPATRTVSYRKQQRITDKSSFQLPYKHTNQSPITIFDNSKNSWLHTNQSNMQSEYNIFNVSRGSRCPHIDATQLQLPLADLCRIKQVYLERQFRRHSLNRKVTVLHQSFYSSCMQ